MNDKKEGGPRVYLASATEYRVPGVEEFLRDEGAPEITESVRSRVRAVGKPNDALSVVETAGRLCYMSYVRGRTSADDFIRNLIESKHGSVLEHVNFGVIIAGVSRSLTHELVRHRAGFAYSQISQRYVDSSSAEFVIPPAIRGNKEAEARFNEATERARDAYAEMADILESARKNSDSAKTSTSRRKAAREAARSVMPNATETKIYATGNVRAWRHFREMRGSEHAVAVYYLLSDHAPSLFYDVSVETGEDGGQVVRVGNSKV